MNWSPLTGNRVEIAVRQLHLAMDRFSLETPVPRVRNKRGYTSPITPVLDPNERASMPIWFSMRTNKLDSGRLLVRS